MLKIFGKIAIILISVFFVLGFIRFAVNGFQGDFLPSWAAIQGWLRDFPNISTEIQEVIANFNRSSGNGFLDFFYNVGNFFILLWTALSAPVRVLVWFFVNFYTPIIT